jgi:hypothetical protein
LNGPVKYWYLLVAAIGLGACAGPEKSLTVKQFYLRDQEDVSNDEPFIRGEKSKFLYGAVSMEERKGRLGQYYTVLWSDKAGTGSGEAEVVFEFQQGKSGSLIKKRVSKFSADNSEGKAEFSVIGDDYFKGGKVLSWKISLLRGGKVVSTKQSYLWK